MFGSDFYGVGCCVCEDTLTLVVFPPKPYFLILEGYVLWVVKLQIVNGIMLKYPCDLHH